MARSFCLVLLLVLAGCGASEPVRIGIVLGGDGIRGAALAAEDINAAGGIRGRPLALRFAGAQTGNRARNALAPAESLAADPTILAVVGHTNSAASLVAARIYNAHKVVQIAPTSTTPLYSQAGEYSFRMVASDEHQAEYLAHLVLKDSALRRVAVLYVNDDYGRGLREGLVRELRSGGKTPRYEAPYAEADGFIAIDEVAQAIARSRPQLLIWLGRAPELGRLLPKLRRLVPGIQVLASDGFNRPPPELDLGSMNGVRYVRLFDPESSRPEVIRLRERYEKLWHEEFSDQYLLAYQAVQVLAEAIRVAGPDRAAVRDFLGGLGSIRPAFEGVLGPVSFDKNGDAPPTYYLLEVTAGGSRGIVQLATDQRLR